ncbi:serine protease Do [Peribacillus frigoritolerans]|uniref:S1 family peptidase n=1 Tax=Peribacillus frigoritolerans TaxID=450367 RepID=UPI0020A0FBEC|nr:serine protease [Peribacillus frigoritolerans]MCP1494578.1 serine protease Do [Peribacillus frigoritolerans]
MDFSLQFETIRNSVVNVLVFDGNGQSISAGSGVLIGDGRRALTCSHCLKPGMHNTVKFSGQNEARIGEIFYNDPVKDIAILDFEEPLGNGVTIKDSSSVMIGHEAFVVGFPNNIDKITALSANIAGFEPLNGYNSIRIDSSINHGNSGGPLFNASGELIGIVNAKHGSINDFLDNIKNAPSGVMIVNSSNGSLDPIQALKELVAEMKRNLNLGIGYSIPVNAIGDSVPFIKELIIN